AFRQFSNRHKELGKQLRATKLRTDTAKKEEDVDRKVATALKARGIEDVPEVEFLESSKKSELIKLRREGKVVLHRDVIMPPSAQSRQTETDIQRRKVAEKKAVAITQLLHGLGLLDRLSYEEQENLIRDIVQIVLLDQ